MNDDGEYYGSPESVAAMKRGATLWALVQGDPRFAFYGRMVGLGQPVDNTVEVLGALARLQGASACYFFPKSDVPALFSALESDGLSTDRHEHFLGGEAAYAAAKRVLSDHSLPNDLTVRRLSEATPGSFIGEAVALMESCGVMPVPAAFLRGKQGRGLCLVATMRITNRLPLLRRCSCIRPAAHTRKPSSGECWRRGRTGAEKRLHFFLARRRSFTCGKRKARGAS